MRRVIGRITKYALAGLLTSAFIAAVLGLLGGNAVVRQSSSNPWRWKAAFVGSTDYTQLLGGALQSNAVTARSMRDTLRGDRFSSDITQNTASSRWVDMLVFRITTWGIPFESLWGWTSNDGSTYQTGGNLSPFLAPAKTKSQTRIFPYLPLWPGLIANAAIFAVGCWGAVWVTRATRGALRRRRGACPACAYDLRANPPGPCPECGHHSGPQRFAAANAPKHLLIAAR